MFFLTSEYMKSGNFKWLLNFFIPIYIACTGTSSGFSGSANEYAKWRSIYSKCVYLSGNLEINHFDPFNSDKDKDAELDKFDFSFLDDIKEITGYIIIYKNRIKNLNLKSLQIVRGINLFENKYSIYIDSNARLERLNFVNLTGKYLLNSHTIYDIRYLVIYF